jgi:hypothetical protein
MSRAAPLFNPSRAPEMTLEAWALLDVDEPGELVDLHCPPESIQVVG